MHGGIKNSLPGAAFHHLTRIHHRNILAHVRHNGNVVRDKDNADIKFLLEFFDFLQNLILNNDIQCGGGLVCNDEFGFAG